MAGTRPRRSQRTRVAFDVIVEAGEWPEAAAIEPLVARALDASLALAGDRIASGAELAVICTDDAHIRALNARHRGKDAATNVLSFPATPPAGGRFGPLLGDIVLSRETIDREAKEQGLTFTDHLTHLMVHGFLHLLGHDHQNESEAVIMERLEAAILASIGIADPYTDAGRDA
jgi:probable rRNA maturation factor